MIRKDDPAVISFLPPPTLRYRRGDRGIETCSLETPLFSLIASALFFSFQVEREKKQKLQAAVLALFFPSFLGAVRAETVLLPLLAAVKHKNCSALSFPPRQRDDSDFWSFLTFDPPSVCIANRGLAPSVLFSHMQMKKGRAHPFPFLSPSCAGETDPFSLYILYARRKQ